MGRTEIPAGDGSSHLSWLSVCPSDRMSENGSQILWLPLFYWKFFRSSIANMPIFIQNLNVLTGQKIPLPALQCRLASVLYISGHQLYGRCIPGDVPAQKNLLTFAAYVVMFPQLVAGPIVRYSDIRSQLENRTHSVEKCAYGIRRFVTGHQKILIANVLGS